MPKRILLLGAGGQVGQTLLAEPLPVDWQLSGFNHAELDITNHFDVRGRIDQLKPDLIINAAALTDVDAAQNNPDLVRRINFDAVGNLAALCTVRDVPIIHLSTDYVFNGKAERPYREDHKMEPINFYGESKMLGEEALRHEFPWHVILRVSLVFGAYGKNILTKMIEQIDRGDEIKGFTDLKAGPTAATEIAKAMIVIGSAILKGKPNGFGTFHLCGEPGATRLEFIQAVMDAYAPYADIRPAVTPIVAADWPDRAPRPAYTVFDCTKIREVYGIEQKPWREGLIEALDIFMRKRTKTS